MTKNESAARIKIDKLLRESDWILPGDSDQINVETELGNDSGVADYVLTNSNGFPLCVLEAKGELLSPFVGKEKARAYAKSLNCRFVILSNGIKHYLWDLDHGNPALIDQFPSQEQLEMRGESFKPQRDQTEVIEKDYIALTQFPKFADHPDYVDPNRRDAFLNEHKLRLLRKYQLGAIKAVQKDVASGKDRFLLEMATGTGKTLTSSALIKMFIRLFGVKHVPINFHALIR